MSLRSSAALIALSSLAAAACVGQPATPSPQGDSGSGSSDGGSQTTGLVATTADTSATGTATTTMDTSATGTSTGVPTTDSGTTEGLTATGSEDSTGSETCIQVTIEEALSQRSGANFWLTTAVSPDLGDEGLPEQFRMEFHDSTTGTVDLGAPPNDNYGTCDQCLRLFADLDGVGQGSQFFQQSGTLEIDVASSPQSGPLIAATNDVVLVEVTIDAKTLESTPVPGGGCIELIDYATEPNNSCLGHCGEASPVPGSFPECSCGANCFISGSCCPDICDAGVCDGEAFCMSDTEVLTAGPGLGLGMPDNAYDGTLGSMSCETLMVAADGIDTIADVAVEIGISHTWVGDLVIKVVAPTGANPITVLSRPGYAEAADDGTGSMGDGSNLAAAAPISFDDAAPDDAEDMGDMLPDNSEVCLDDGQCEFFPNSGSAIPGDFSSLAGQNSVGLWEVCVGDAASGDFGAVDFIELTIGQVP